MRTIHKYALVEKERQEIPMPKGATLLYVGLQSGRIMLWAEVDDEDDLIRRVIDCYGTGFDLPVLLGPHIGTVVTAGGSFVWHFFDMGERAS